MLKVRIKLRIVTHPQAKKQTPNPVSEVTLCWPKFMTVVVEMHWVDLSFHPEPHFFFLFSSWKKLFLNYSWIEGCSSLETIFIMWIWIWSPYWRPWSPIWSTFLLNPIQSSIKPALSASVQKPHIQVQLFIHMIFDLSQA